MCSLEHLKQGASFEIENMHGFTVIKVDPLFAHNVRSVHSVCNVRCVHNVCTVCCTVCAVRDAALPWQGPAGPAKGLAGRGPCRAGRPVASGRPLPAGRPPLVGPCRGKAGRKGAAKSSLPPISFIVRGFL